MAEGARGLGGSGPVHRGGTPRRDTVEHRVAGKRRCARLRNGPPDPVVPSIRLTARELLEQYRCLERVMSKICRANGPRVYSRCCSPSPLPRARRSSIPDVGRGAPSCSHSARREVSWERSLLTRALVSRNYRSRHSGSGAALRSPSPREARLAPSTLASSSLASSTLEAGGAPSAPSFQRSLLQSWHLPLLLSSSPTPRVSSRPPSGSRGACAVELIERN